MRTGLNQLTRCAAYAQLLKTLRLDLFLKFATIGTAETLLDVGRAPGFNGEFQRFYNSFKRVVTVNLRVDRTVMSRGHRSLVAGNGRALPFKSHSFDWVFSNAVIEHVGGWQKQKLFGSEIGRVAHKGYFCRNSKQVLPDRAAHAASVLSILRAAAQRLMVHVSPGYLRHDEEINLLSARQPSALFPEARIYKVGLPGFPNSLVQLYRPDALPRTKLMKDHQRGNDRVRAAWTFADNL